MRYGTDCGALLTINRRQKPPIEEVLPACEVSVEGMLVLLMIPFPKYSAMTENPSFEPFTCWKKLSCSLELCSKFLFISRTDLYSGAHSGHSFSLSPRHLRWNECIHIKCTAGRSRVKVHAVHLLSWKILAFVLRSWISFLIVKVFSCATKATHVIIFKKKYQVIIQRYDFSFNWKF